MRGKLSLSLLTRLKSAKYKSVNARRILSQFGIPVQVNLTSVGTNLQDQVLAPTSWNVSINNNVTNSPFSFAGVFADLTQVLGSRSAAKAFGEELVSSIEARAKAIVASGGSTSVEGMKKILTQQATNIVEQGGMFLYALHKLVVRLIRHVYSSSS